MWEMVESDFTLAPRDAAGSPARREAVRAIGAAGLAALAAFGLADASSAKKKKRKKTKKKGSRGSGFATRLEFSEFSDPLPVETGSQVVASVDCGGPGRVVSCGYQINGVGPLLVNTAITVVEPNGDLSSCAASLQRASDVGATAGAQIQAVAICLE
jgi:hypothetical protein